MAANIINTWNPSHQNLLHIMNGMSFIGVPPSLAPSRSPQQDYTILHGLRSAVEVATEFTDLQKEKIEQNDGQPIPNRCRVICITSARDNESMKRLEEIFLSVLIQQNKVVGNSETLLKIDHCHLVIINTYPVNIVSPVNNHPPTVVSKINLILVNY